MASLTRTNRIKLTALHYAVSARRAARFYAWRLLSRLPGNRAAGQGNSEEPAAGTGRARPQHDAILRFSDVWVEPRYGFAIREPATLLPLSVTHGESIWTADGRAAIGIPSPLAFLMRRRSKAQLFTGASVVSPWGENYYHLLMDILPKLSVMLAKNPELARSDILISRDLFSAPFFQNAAARGELSRLRFRPVPDRSFLPCKDLFVPVVAQNDSLDMLIEIRRLLGVSPVIPHAGTYRRRIFITRSPQRGRNIQNWRELEPILSQYGFQIVDFDFLTVDQQIDMVKSCEVLAGIHGAALVNLLFAPQDVTILEVHPPTKDINCFRNMSLKLQLKFDRVYGTTDVAYFDKRGDFFVSPSALEDGLKRLGLSPL